MLRQDVQGWQATCDGSPSSNESYADTTRAFTRSRLYNTVHERLSIARAHQHLALFGFYQCKMSARHGRVDASKSKASTSAAIVIRVIGVGGGTASGRAHAWSSSDLSPRMNASVMAYASSSVNCSGGCFMK